MLGCVQCALQSNYPPLSGLALEAQHCMHTNPFNPRTCLAGARIPFKDDYPVVIRSGVHLVELMRTLRLVWVEG